MDPVVLWAHAVAVARVLEGRYPTRARELVDSSCAAAVKAWWNAGVPQGPCPIRQTLPDVPVPGDAAALLAEIARVAPPSVRTKARHLLRALKSGQPSKGNPERMWTVTADDV